MSTKEDLLGNGFLTVAARIFSVVGGALVLVLSFIAITFGSEVWGEIEASRVERQAIMVKLGAYEEKFLEIARRNDVQDVAIERLRDRVKN